MPRVSKFCVFLSLSLSLSLVPAPPPFPLPLSSNSLNCGGLSKVHSLRRLLEVEVGYGVIMLGKRDQWLNSFGASISKKKSKNSLNTYYKTQQSACYETTLLSSTNSHSHPFASICIQMQWHVHTHVNTNRSKQTEAALTSCLSASWTASCCTCGPCLVFCLFVGEVVCVVVKVKGKHSSFSSDV